MAREPNLPPTREDQEALTPEIVLADLIAGNRWYLAERTRPRNASERRKVSAGDQFPKAAILSCLDSRVPVEEVFDQGIGDIFVGRVAGNIEDVDQLGSLEFAVASGVKLVVVLGHSNCGAVGGAIDIEDPENPFDPDGNFRELLNKIRPAVRSVPGPEPRRSDNPIFFANVVEQNVRQTVARIRTKSPPLNEAAEMGTIEILGAIYDLKTGRVEFLET